MATCSELEGYLQGQLVGADAQAFEAHLEACAACAKRVARQLAVKRATAVLQRNQASKNASRKEPPPPPSPAQPQKASGALLFAPSATPSVEPVADTDEPAIPSRRPWTIAAGAGTLVLAVIVAWLLWPNAEVPSSSPSASSLRASAAQPVEASPATTPSPPAAAEVAAPAPTASPATVPSLPAAVEVAAPPAASPAVAHSPPPAAEVAAPAPAASPAIAHSPPPAAQVTAPAPAAAVAPAASAGPGTAEPLPLDTDLDVLAQIVASPRCAPAIAPLRARVAKDDWDAKAWALLAQCYSKRKRLRNAVTAYNKALKRADPTLTEALRPQAEAARAALEAATESKQAAADSNQVVTKPQPAATKPEAAPLGE